MRVLVVEDVDTAADPVIERLLDAGVDVARCNDPGAPGFPCKGLEHSAACPLDEQPIDVAIVVRRAAHEAPTSREAGVRCALRRHIPLVEVGRHLSSPYLGHAAAISQGPETVVRVVERTAAAGLPAHGVEAERMFRLVLDLHDLHHVSATAEVHRSDGNLTVVLSPDEEIPKPVADMASVRVLGAIRALDPGARTVGVSIIGHTRTER